MNMLGNIEIASSELNQELVNQRSPRIDEPIQEEPATAEEPKVILNIDSSTSLVNADFLNSMDPSSLQMELLPSDIREDLIKKQGYTGRKRESLGAQINVLDC